MGIGGDTRRSEWTIIFILKVKQGEERGQRLAKRKHEELPLTVLIEQTLTSTLIVENEFIETPV